MTFCLLVFWAHVALYTWTTQIHRAYKPRKPLIPRPQLLYCYTDRSRYMQHVPQVIWGRMRGIHSLKPYKDFHSGYIGVLVPARMQPSSLPGYKTGTKHSNRLV